MKNKGAKAKLKRKGAFGCDLTEYLESSGQDVPLVLKSCAEFIECHGVVDGIYRLSGITSNIRKLRQEFGSDQCPDLTREVFLQDIHCVGSLCKLYFRELPNPLLTYQLYTKFTDSVSCSVEEDQLSQIQNVIAELPPSHYRTLEYLSRHLTHIASFSSTTNMHIRNLALVWAPNLLRSKEIEDAGCNGDAAFLEVRVQQVVIEFILNHVEQIFNKSPTSPTRPRDCSDLFPAAKASPTECRIVKSMTLPVGSLPMKLVSLEEAQARSLSATHPARKERRENSLPEIVPVSGTLFHTVIDLPENKRKLSTKSKKWKSIFNLGRSGTESKSKLSRNGSVFVRGQKEMSEKATIRPAKSMDSLCSLPVQGEDEKVSRFKRSVATGGFFVPVLKSRATGTGSTYDVSKQDSEWDSVEVAGATGSSSQDRTTLKTSQTKPPPEQLKVFRIGDDLENEQNSPKGRKMFYASSDGPAKSSFPGSLFPLEASPRHQRKALNISEPFAVSVPLRVSAVISANSTPCRGSSKERHLLSSLEELPLLEPDLGVKFPAAEPNSRTGHKAGARPTDVAEPVKVHEPRRPCLKDLSPDFFEEDDRTLTLKEILLEMSQIPDLLPSSAADRKPADLTLMFVSELPQVRDLKPNRPETAPPKAPDTTPINNVDNLFPNNQEEDESITLLEPIWSNIQHELKIIESEEDLAVHSESVLDCKRAPSPPTPNNNSVKPDSSSDGSSGLYETKDAIDSLGVATGGIREDSRNQNDDLIPPIATELENGNALPQEAPQCTERDQTVIDRQDSRSNPKKTVEDSNVGFLKLPPTEVDSTVSGLKEEETQTEGNNLQVSVDLEREEDLVNKMDERKSSESLENDDEFGTESTQTFELEEFEDHHWVTSPLHSPKLKNILEKEVAVIQPKRRGTTGELYKRPEFTRSLSLDSKDTRTSQWTMKLAGIKADGGYYIRSRTEYLFNQKLQSEPRQVVSNQPEVPVLGIKIDSCSKTETIERTSQTEPVVKRSWMKASDVVNPNATSPAVPLNSLHILPNVQEINASTDVCGQAQQNESEKPKTRPSSLSLDITPKPGDIFTFENAAAPNPVEVTGQQVHQSSTETTLSLHNRSQSLNQKPVSYTTNQSTDLDCTSTSHAPTGRRNSAPVSVSAVRASFMIKMCQAKAVPVIPPKVQYTQIPQPLQTVNTESDVPLHENKDVGNEPDSTPKPILPLIAGHNNIPQSPKTDIEAVEEKENSDPVSIDTSYHSSLNSSTDNNHCVPHDPPVLRRKRTSDGETSADTPLSSKMERPSGLSKSSFRSRTGRPQSLILFSPPFPIMDHPSVDSRMFLAPIKSPSQTTSQESTYDSQRTPDGVILRSKMTIPKNGQRLETSTSCFYQPQRRSVILDSRSGRQIE